MGFGDMTGIAGSTVANVPVFPTRRGPSFPGSACPAQGRSRLGRRRAEVCLVVRICAAMSILALATTTTPGSAWCDQAAPGTPRSTGGPPAPASVAHLEAVAGRAVSAIELEGERHTRDHVILREIETPLGEPLDLRILAADLIRLANTNLFASVTVGAREVEEGIVLGFEVKENPRLLVVPAIDYSEENGFSFGGSALALNLTGRGLVASGSGLFGGQNQGWLSFVNPWWTGNRVSLELAGGRIEREDRVREFDESSDQAVAAVSSWLGRSGRVGLAASWFQMRADRSGHTLSSDQQDTLVSLVGRLGWDTRDAWRDPHRGWHTELRVGKTGGPLGGDADFWGLKVDLRRYQPIVPKHTLAMGALLSTRTGTVGRDVPPFVQFHLGGANTIRGHDVEVLGKQLFGKNELLATAEYRYTVLPPSRVDLWRWSVSVGFQLAAFADTGLAWTESREFARERFRSGVGLGARLLIPGAEMLRLDLGYSREGGWRFHLGVLSKFDAQRSRIR